MMEALPVFIYILFFSIKLSSSTSYTCNPSISCGCSTPSTVVTSKIIGGEAAYDHTWGWIVSLQRSNKHSCGASLLTTEYAVTAAHCVNGIMDDLSVLSILAGTNYLNDASNGIQRRSVDDVFIHPNFDQSNFTNDIAILHFSPLVISSNSYLAFICLPKEYQDPFQVDTNLVAIGWGVTDEFGSTSWNDLQQVTVKAFSSTSTDCIAGQLMNTTVQFCAGISAGGKDTCHGDSGGPLMAFVNNRWVLAGLTSTGIGCAEPGRSGVYTRVSYFIPFINSLVNSTELEITTTPAATSKNQQNNNQSSFKINHGNLIRKSITILMFCFLILFFSQ